MGIYSIDHFHSKDEALRYYLDGARHFMNEGAEHFNKDNVLQGESSFAKAKIFVDLASDAMDHDYE